MLLEALVRLRPLADLLNIVKVLHQLLTFSDSPISGAGPRRVCLLPWIVDSIAR